jgi:hypothetical protein
MKKTFEYVKETKNTFRFQEKGDENLIIGPLYIQKTALAELGYKDGDEIEVTIAIKEK